MLNIKKKQLIFLKFIFLEANPALRSAFLVAFVFLYRAKIVSVGHSFAATKNYKATSKSAFFGLPAGRQVWAKKVPRRQLP
jgi:hypothetical protein